MRYMVLMISCFTFMLLSLQTASVSALDLNWNEIARVVPIPRERTGAAGIYDPVRDAFYIFGGWQIDLSLFNNEIWRLDCGTEMWTNVTPAAGPSPDARAGSAVIYDAIGDRMVLFGGNVLLSRFNDLWEFNLISNTWTQITPINSPPSARTECGSIFDPAGNRLLVFGGLKNGFILPEQTNELWEFSFATLEWTDITPAGDKPSPRDNVSAVYDPIHHWMVIFGGYSGNIFGWEEYSDTWVYDLSNRAFINRTHPFYNPPHRSDHGAIYDPYNNKMIIFGGGTLLALAFLNDVWSLNLNDFTWTEEIPTGIPPKSRGGMVCDLDKKRGRMLAFGGHYLNVSSAGVLNETWELTGLSTIVPALSTGMVLCIPVILGSLLLRYTRIFHP